MAASPPGRMRWCARHRSTARREASAEVRKREEAAAAAASFAVIYSASSTRFPAGASTDSSDDSSENRSGQRYYRRPRFLCNLKTRIAGSHGGPDFRARSSLRFRPTKKTKRRRRVCAPGPLLLESAPGEYEGRSTVKTEGRWTGNLSAPLKRPTGRRPGMIKAKPEDFVVEERADLPLRRHGEYRVYLLRKSHWNTLDLIHHLSRSLGLPPEPVFLRREKG